MKAGNRRLLSHDLTLTTALVHIFATAATAAAPPSFIGLGTHSTLRYEYAGGISADGLTVFGPVNDIVCGDALSPRGCNDPRPVEAWRWTMQGGMLGLGTESTARAISADGSIVVGQAAGGAARWTDQDGWVNLPFDFASGVSADGSVVVGSTNGSGAIRWTLQGGPQSLGILPGYFSSHATSVSADGSTVVGYSAGGPYPFTFQSFRWTPATGMVGLGFTIDSRGNYVRSVSADGSVMVGLSWNFTNAEEAFRRTSDGLDDKLGFLPGMTRSDALAVSGNGSVVVGSSWSGQTAPSAFIWTAAQGMRSLRDVLIADYGLDLNEWTLTEARGISEDGLTIVGIGSTSRGPESWIAHVPEPSSMSMIFLSAAFIARMKRRSRYT